MLDVRLYEYIKEIVLTHDAMKRAEMMVRGCVRFFPFERASIFTYSPLNHIGEGIFQVEQDRVFSMQWIKEDVRLIPPIFQAVTSNQPQFIDIRKNRRAFPEKYIQQFSLTTLAIIPISHSSSVIGCVLVDRYTGKPSFMKYYLEYLSHYFRLIIESANHPVNPPQILSKREVEVLQHLANGYSIKEMASVMTISEFTVRDYLSSVVRKFGVNHRAEAVAVGLRKRIIQ